MKSVKSILFIASILIFCLLTKQAVAQLTAGERCNTGEECASGWCINYQCSDLSDGAHGADGADGTQCRDQNGVESSEYCDSGCCINGICEPRTECDKVVNGMNGLAAGERCNTGEQCASGWCINYQCSDLYDLSDGTQCRDENGVESSEYCDSGCCMNGICEPRTECDKVVDAVNDIIEKLPLIIGLVCGAVGLCLFGLFVFCCCCKKNNKNGNDILLNNV